MDERVQRALTLIARATAGDPSRPIPVQALGLDSSTDGACTVHGLTLILEAQYGTDFDPGCSESLGLIEVTLDAPAATGQPFVFTGPLTHYLTHGTADLFDRGQPGNWPLPVAFLSGSGVVIGNGTHRYVASRLLGEPARVLLVTEPPACRCPVPHPIAERMPVGPHTYLA